MVDAVCVHLALGRPSSLRVEEKIGLDSLLSSVFM